MIPTEKLTAFLQTAAAIRARTQPADVSSGADARGLVASDHVVAQLGWPAEDRRYFQDDAENLVRELEYQGALVIWQEDRLAGAPAAPTWLVCTFHLTDKGLAQAWRR